MEDISLSVSLIEIVNETQEPVLEVFQELFSMYLSFVYLSTLSTFDVFGFLDSINMQMNKCFSYYNFNSLYIMPTKL